MGGGGVSCAALWGGGEAVPSTAWQNQKARDAVFMGGLHYQLPKESSCYYEMEIICKARLKATRRHSLGIIDIGMT